MVTPRGRKTRFKSQIAKVVFGHLFLSTKNRSEIVSISSRRPIYSLTDYAHKVAIYTFAQFCANCFGIFRPFWPFLAHFWAFCDDKISISNRNAILTPTDGLEVATVICKLYAMLTIKRI